MSTYPIRPVEVQKPLPPAPGEAASRTSDTEAAYLRRALAFEAFTARQLSIVDPSPAVVAAHARERREEWAKPTWRQYKAALIYRFHAMGTPESLEAVELLRDGDQSMCLKKTRRTSGRRSKSVSKDDLMEVLKEVRASGSKYAPFLTTWLLLGAQIGLRPHEWGQASLVIAKPEEIGDSAVEPGGPALPYLRIRNGKDTNGRSHGDYRHLNLSGLKQDVVQLVGKFTSMMADVVNRGAYEKYYAACKKLLYRINLRLHGDDDQRWIQLYSPRHRFSADAKKQLDAAGVAALMGHGTTKTAARHYGRRVAGDGSLGPRPVAAEVARVRVVAGYTPRATPRATPALPATGLSKGTDGA